MSSIRRLSAYTACLLAAIAATTQASNSAIEYDENGSPVIDTDGVQITYSAEELAAAKTAAAMSAGAASVSQSSAVATGEGPYQISMDLVWRHSVWGANLGESGITAIDLEGDGTTEIVLGTTLARNFGANKNWHVLRHNPASGRYEIVFTSDDNPDYFSDRTEINSVSVYELSGKTHVLIGYTTGKLLVFDGATLSRKRELDVSTAEIVSVVVADGDNDGIEEIMVSTEDDTYLYNPLTFQKESEFGLGGREISVGNVDNDPELEIVFVEGPVIEYNGTVFTQEWDFSEFTPGRWLELADLDGDGVQEIIAARAWTYIDVLDARNKTPIGQITTPTNISQLKVADVNGNGKPDILYGDQQHGYVHAVDGMSLVELWRLENPSSGAPGIEVADVDDDGELEVIWGAGSNSTAPDFLSVHSISTLESEFVNVDEGGPYRALAIGNTDADNADEIVFAADEGDSYDGSHWVSMTPLHVISSVDFSPKWNTFDYDLGNRYYAYYDLAVGDIDGGGDNEIVSTAESAGGLSTIDGVNKALKSSERIGSDTILSVGLADFDGDGDDEIVGMTDNQLHIVDGATLDIIWSSIVLASTPGANSIEATDLSGDGIPDLIASLGRLLIIDGDTKFYRQTTESNYGGFSIVEDADGNKQILAGTSSGQLVKLTAETFEREVLGDICDGAVNSVKASASEVFADSVQFACHDTIGIWGIPENEVLWRSPVLGTQVGQYNNLIATEQDEKALLMVGTGFGVYAFQGFEVSNRDIDDDGVLNQSDNCPKIANVSQDDSDGDGIGDACNSANDSDGDDWSDALDNCPLIPNPGQEDADGNGRGDSCESLPPGC